MCNFLLASSPARLRAQRQSTAPPGFLLILDEALTTAPGLQQFSAAAKSWIPLANKREIFYLTAQPGRCKLYWIPPMPAYAIDLAALQPQALRIARPAAWSIPERPAIQLPSIAEDCSPRVRSITIDRGRCRQYSARSTLS
ncbi:MAG: hypothetical protein U5K43_09635 [Halofilum sp. (in: g-proteobacteria)]|nr:hypothetical protein [Halofilum sp. (in: g-proteobacteria)]